MMEKRLILGCFDCPCCGKKIGFGDRHKHDERVEFMKQHIICCASINVEPIKYGEPFPLDGYLKQVGIDRN